MKKFIFALLALSLFSMTALAQSSRGTLIGSVSDPSGVIQNATVVVKDNQSGREKTVQTNDQGNFTVPDLDVGTYTVTITMAGHKTYIAKEVKIDTGKDFSLSAVLEVGEVSENVTVVAGADVLNTTDAQLATNIGPRQLLELPLLTRNPLALILTSAGAASNPSQNTSINGQRTSATNIIRDGVNINDNFIRSNATDFAPQRPSVDDIGEFTISSQNAADGGFGAAQLQLSTPRGQNAFHGAVFEYNRNSKFAANSFFNNAAGVFAATDAQVLSGLKQAGDPRLPRPFRNRNQFGAKGSGPIWKNHLFFFGYYEGLRDVVTSNKLTTTFRPGTAAGNFTYNAACTNTGGNNCPAGVSPNQLITVNILGAAVSGGSGGTGISTIDPTIQARFLSRLPAGNTTEAGDGRNTTGFRFSQAANQNRDSITSRTDYDINNDHSINVVYNHVHEGNLRTDIDNSFNLVPLATQPSDNNFLAMGWRGTFTPKLSNELTGGFFRSIPVFHSAEGFKTSNFIIPTLVTNPEVTFLDQGRKVLTENVNENATYIMGNHSFRFGGQFQNVNINAFNDASTTPTYNLGTNINTPQITTAQFTNNAIFPGTVPTAQRATANSLLALLGGIVNTASATFNVADQTSGYILGATQRRIFNFKQWAGYFSDQWRATSTLTLNLGLRYDFQTPLTMTNGLALEPVLKNNDPIATILDPAGTFQFVGGNAGRKNAFYRPDKNNIAPNISFAWAPRFKEGGLMSKLFGDGKTVIRGGIRMDYTNDELVRAPDNALANNSGLSQASNVINPVTGTTALNARVSALPAIPVPVFSGPNRTFLQNNNAGALQAAAFIVDPNIQTPRSTEYSFSIQRELGWNMVWEGRYVGSRSNNMFRASDFNQVDIRSNGFAADFDRAYFNRITFGDPRGPSGTCTAAQATATGCKPLTVFPNLASGGLLTNSTILGQIDSGIPADLAVTYIINALTGSVKFTANPNIFVADELYNGAFFRYNSFQTELRRRFAGGLWLNANYTFEKELTNGQGTAQGRVEAFLDNAQPQLEIARADYDQTQVFNLTAIYELPFGKGKRFFGGAGSWTNRLLGGWEVTSIGRWSTGAPITVVDPRGTLNRAGRSARQTAVTSLSKAELKQLVGPFVTANGVFYFNPSLLGRNPDGSLISGATGAGANGFNSPTFTGQVFFNDRPGTTSGLERSFFNGPSNWNLDASVIKNVAVTERFRVQLRGEFFNIFNHTQFSDPGQFISINGTSFSRITSLATSARITQFGLRIEF